jgi:hypothetical protein
LFPVIGFGTSDQSVAEWPQHQLGEPGRELDDKPDESVAPRAGDCPALPSLYHRRYQAWYANGHQR